MKLTNEGKIGILVFAVLVLLAALTWKAGNFSFIQKGYAVKVTFRNIERVERNAPVTLNGLEVGRVQDIQILYGEQTRIELTLWLEGTARLHEGATAMIKNMGFMGEKYIGLTSGDDSRPYLKEGAVINGEEPPSLEAVLRQGEDVAKNLKEISSEVNQRLKVNSAVIDEILADLRTTMRHMATVSENVDERLKVNGGYIDATMAHLNAASQNLEEMSADLKENPWKLMYKPKTVHSRR